MYYKKGIIESLTKEDKPLASHEIKEEKASITTLRTKGLVIAHKREKNQIRL